jgi:hypothetical protein
LRIYDAHLSQKRASSQPFRETLSPQNENVQFLQSMAGADSPAALGDTPAFFDEMLAFVGWLKPG